MIEKIGQIVIDDTHYPGEDLYCDGIIEDEILNIVKNNNYLKNKQVYATINNKSTLVTVLDINEDNSLKVLIDNNEINLYSGEITFNKT